MAKPMTSAEDRGTFLGVRPPKPEHTCTGPGYETGHPDWTVWRCALDGFAWRLEPDTTDYGHDWQPGDVRRSVWRRFPSDDREASDPPSSFACTRGGPVVP